jgi:hypothetical protein
MRSLGIYLLKYPVELVVFQQEHRASDVAIWKYHPIRLPVQIIHTPDAVIHPPAPFSASVMGWLPP